MYEPKLMEELFEEEKKKPVLTKKNTKSVCMYVLII